MGGLLAADVALLFRHRILGIINFDVPFVGMHPGIIKAGLGSIFTKVPPPQDQILTSPTTAAKPSRMSTIFNPKPADPNYNPSFANDVHLPVRKGLDNALHWFNKHSNNIKEAGKGLVKSHFEFGSAMADYKELKDRYARVRALEEDDQLRRTAGNPGVRSPPRIRFVNYYTASTGRPKKPKSPKSPSPSRPGSVSLHRYDSDASAFDTKSQHDLSRLHSGPDSPPPPSSIAVQEHRGSNIVYSAPPDITSATGPQQGLGERDAEQPVLPEIPPIPQEPPFVDLAHITDRAQRRAAEREYDQALEEHHRAVKARNRIIDEREDIQEEWDRQRQKKTSAPAPQPAPKPQLTGEALRLEQERERMAREQARLEGREYHPPCEDTGASAQEPPAPASAEETPALDLDASTSRSSPPYASYAFSRSAILSQPPPADSDHASVTSSSSSPSVDPAEPRPKKDAKLRKFCMLPPKDAAGHKDPTWVRVHMEGMDEVAAHTSLFFVNETYEKLVGDVGARVEEWVGERESLRIVESWGKE